ncbi:MAG: protein-glutamate O-methyltransferase CheR [Planctomycetota bacterium]
MTTEAKDLTQKDYELIRRLVYFKSGINLGDQKQQLVRARLGKRVREGGFSSFRDYYHYVEKDQTGEELCYLLDAISTNTTHLFREMRHFTLLQEILRGWVNDSKWRSEHDSLRIWSAGCSSGEEPYSIAMVVHDVLRAHAGVKVKLLATDLSTQMLSKAALGLYEVHRVGTVPPDYRHRYLKKATANGQECLQVVPEVRRLITFSRFNLMTKRFPFRHGFHIVFCRNVMIYFDRETQTTLVGKYAEQLLKGGYLMIGHSESLSSIDHPLSYVEPTVYRKD